MKALSRLLLFGCISCPLLGFSLHAAAKRNLPPPLKVSAPFESAWKAMVGVIRERGLEISQENRAEGILLTEAREYSSGPLTGSHIAKIGEKPKLSDADWVRVTYQFEVVLELVSARETMVIVYANIRALKRDFLGTESWVDIPANGALEEALLTDFGKSLFGQTFQLDVPKKGFWERDPQYLPDASERIPKVVGPERP